MRIDFIRGSPVFRWRDLVLKALKEEKWDSKSGHAMSCLYLNSTMWVIVSVMFVSCDGRIVEDSVDEGGVEKVPEEVDMRELT